MAAVVNKFAPGLLLVACFLQAAVGSVSLVAGRGGRSGDADLVLAFASWRVDGKAVLPSTRFGNSLLRPRLRLFVVSSCDEVGSVRLCAGGFYGRSSSPPSGGGADWEEMVLRRPSSLSCGRAIAEIDDFPFAGKLVADPRSSRRWCGGASVNGASSIRVEAASETGSQEPGCYFFFCWVALYRVLLL